jgi:hypothetical protein
MVSAPLGAFAGWRDALDSAERVDKLIVNRPTPPPEPVETSDEPPPLQSEPRSAAPRGNDDAHFIQPDDYFINNEELGSHSYIYVSLAKMVTAPSSNSKDEGEFMKVHDGQNLWTSHIWQSRIASKNELRIGMHFIAFHDNHQNGVYQAPNKKDRARGGTWWYAKITDMSDMYKGFVTVSGNYKVGLNNIRIPIPYGPQGR